MTVKPTAAAMKSQVISQAKEIASAPMVATVTNRMIVTTTGKIMRPVPWLAKYSACPPSENAIERCSDYRVLGTKFVGLAIRRKQI